MSEVNNIPRLRFPSFYDEWKHDKLGNVINFQNGVGHERSIDENGNVVVVNSKFISTEGTVRKYTDKVLSIIPDDSLCMVMSDVPNGKAIAKCYYFETGNHFSLNQRICSIKSETEVNKFLFYRINRHKYYLKFDNGVGQTNLRKSEVLNCPIKLPSLSEQQKIADFLTAVDKRIELLEKKKTLLETYKKGVMKKIFNQEIRFKDDNGNDFPDWEEKRLDDVFKSSKGKGLSKDKISDHGRHKAVLYGELYTTYNEVAYTIKSYTDFDEGTKSRVGDLLVPCSTTTSNIDLANVTAIMENDIRLGGDITILRTTGIDIDNIFYSYYLSNHKKYELAKFGQGTTIVHLYYSHFKKMKVNVPSLEEQIKISNFLSSIDNQIELLDTQINKSRTWKKGLLQKMFV